MTAPSARAWAAPEQPAAGTGIAFAPGAGPEAAVARSSDWREAGGGRDGSAGGRGWSDKAPPGEPPPLPAPLRPLTVSDLLDGAWAVIACRARTVLALSALFVLPAEVAASFLVRGYGQALDAGTAVTVLAPFLVRSNRGLESSWAGLGAMAVLSIAYALLGAAIGRLVSAWYDDTDLRLGQVLGATLRASPAVLVAWVVTSVLQLLSVCFFVLPALFVFPLLMLVSPIITIEKRGPFAAIRRSSKLVVRRYAAVMGIWLVALLLERVLDLTLAAAPAFLATFAPDPFDEVLRSAGWAFALFVTAPTVAGLSVILYYDLRVRAEGLDLEADAADAFAPLERARG